MLYFGCSNYTPLFTAMPSSKKSNGLLIGLKSDIPYCVFPVGLAINFFLEECVDVWDSPQDKILLFPVLFLSMVNTAPKYKCPLCQKYIIFVASMYSKKFCSEIEGILCSSYDSAAPCANVIKVIVKIDYFTCFSNPTQVPFSATRKRKENVERSFCT